MKTSKTKKSPKKVPEIRQPHQWTHTGDEVLILKRIPKNRTTHNGAACIVQMSKPNTSGYASKLAASGKDSICAIASNGGRVQVGCRGAFAIGYWDPKDGWGFVVGKEGVDGVKAGGWYHVENGKLVAE